MHISQQCCGINVRGLREAFSHGKILLICSLCRDKLKGQSITSYFAERPVSLPPNAPDLATKFQQLCGVVETLSKKIDDIASKPKPLPTTPLCDSPIWPRRSVKRRRDERQLPIRAAAELGTKDISLNDLSVPSIFPAVAKNKFWLYLSGLNPLATNNDVQKIVSCCLGVPDDVEAIRLVPKDKVVTSLTFVSYKVGLDLELKDKALDPASWPVGLLFREFVGQPKNVPRRPRMEEMN